jgi:hypothetical protein
VGGRAGVHTGFRTIILVLYIGSSPNLAHDSPAQGNHVVKFGKDPIYRTSYHVETTLLSKIIFIVVVTLTFDPKINRVLPLLQGNHVAKFVKDPIYKTKVIVQKRPSCQKLWIFNKLGYMIPL